MDAAELARRFEAKTIQLTLALASESLVFGPGRAAAFGGPGGYSNRVSGLGLTPDEIDAAVAFFDARGEDTKLELTSLADPELVALVGARGFLLRFFANVYVRTPVPGPIAFERLDRADDALVEAVARHNEDVFVPGADSALARALTAKNLRLPTSDTVIARDGGEIVGVGCSESSDGITSIFGGAVKPDHRGRGLQRALLDARLAIAAERGSELVFVVTSPNTSSERNVLRAGFRLAYVRAYFNRPRPAQR